MLILAIDTSAAASVALVDGETVVAQRTEFSARRHVEYVGPALTHVLEAGGRPDAVAVGVGPGPFTGLRAGIAAGIGAAVGADVPVHGVVSHDALALRTLAGPDPAADGPSGASGSDRGLGGPSSPVLVATDARRREVYTSLYSGLDDDGLPVVQAGPAVLAPAAVEDWLQETAPGPSPRRVGRGFVLHREALGAPLDEEPEALDPTAAWVARVAHRALAAGRTLPGTEPLYLREPDAAPTPRRSTPLT
ncbi:tRNA (adenosine(37)-N6)-threonylcarbamoyltransferase complex dimerization subunit type 1 TsaB [Brevibacterium senegalense]|uniref:tRNA (adenosine(37)-N6)-threonylcarbamoyltransferase complex dimerization subunit type 1 TsaB n=1 Tax=Brevibacterium senegalense TaxID=1033736 RepID=UPI0002FB2530|nr:tRNA (adenosine(37)-N6)-threonylcarbamoyltransferase complex dimerization subunit type 1 TsaB [Brevibacterium senegalense]